MRTNPVSIWIHWIVTSPSTTFYPFYPFIIHPILIYPACGFFKCFIQMKRDSQKRRIEVKVSRRTIQTTLVASKQSVLGGIGGFLQFGHATAMVMGP